MKQGLKDIFENLTGNWVLQREIFHLDTNITEVASGVASFSKVSFDQPNAMFYEETGVLFLQKNSKEIKFNRKYIYILHDNTIDIILNDGVTKGELFQSLTPQKNIQDLKGSEHICRLDKHNGKHFFESKFSFQTEYTVIGPNTNLWIKSNYVKSF